MGNSEEFMIAVKAVINKVDDSILKNRTETIKLKFLINEDAIKAAQERLVAAEANFKKMMQSNSMISSMSGGAKVSPAYSSKEVIKAQKELESATNQYNKAMVQKAGLVARDIDSTNKQSVSHKSFGAQLGSVATRLVEYALASGVLYAALGELKKEIQFIIDLNKEMTNIRLVGGYSKEEIQGMAKGYNELGKEMGVSTLEIAKGK